MGVSVMEKQRSWSFCTIGVEVALATPHGLLNAKVNNSQRHAYTIILIISCCPQAVITYTPYFPNVSNLFLMSRIISQGKLLPFATSPCLFFSSCHKRDDQSKEKLRDLLLAVSSWNRAHSNSAPLSPCWTGALEFSLPKP